MFDAAFKLFYEYKIIIIVQFQAYTNVLTWSNLFFFSIFNETIADLPSYVTRFQWDMAKYPIKQSLRNIADIISKQVGQIDADLKTKSAAYNNLKGNLQNLEKKQT